MSNDASQNGSPLESLSSEIEGPVQVITVSPNGETFQLHEERLAYVLGQVSNIMTLLSPLVVVQLQRWQKF